MTGRTMCLLISHGSNPSLPGGYTPSSREPAELDGESQLQQDRRHERRDRADEERRGVDQAVDPRTGPLAGDDAEEQADADTDDGGGPGEAQRVEQRIAQRGPHLAAALDAARPLVGALDERPQPLEVAPDVAPEPFVQPVDLVGTARSSCPTPAGWPARNSATGSQPIRTATYTRKVTKRTVGINQSSRLTMKRSMKPA